MKIEELYFYHETLNRLYFDGKLEAVIMKTSQLQNGIEAQLVRNTEPFVMLFDYDTLKEAEEEEDKLYIITMLLHEMIHQYNCENDVEDVEAGKHTQVFKDTAEAIGMTRGGYGLSESQKKQILKTMRNYTAIADISLWE